MTKPVTILAWVVLSLLAGAVGGLAAAPGAWYAELSKPSWNPPSWVFGPVWTTLYVMMGVAAALAWSGRSTRTGRAGFALFGLQLGLNALWSWLFFRWHRPDLALADLVVLWVTVLGNVVAFRRIRPVAGWLLVPYLCWVTFAGMLNASISARNPGDPSGALPREPATGFATADCAPWDGAATSIYLSDGADLERQPTPPYLRLTVYDDREHLSRRRVTLGRQEAGSGVAVRCQLGDVCEGSSTGTIQFDALGPEGDLVGSYQLNFAGDLVAGAFRARWLSRPALCG